MPLADVAWIADGHALVVQGRLLYEVASGTLRPLPGSGVAVSASGKRIAWEEGEAIYTADFESLTPGDAVRAPPVTLQWGADSQPESRDIVLAWLDDRRLYLHAFDRSVGDQSCHVLDTKRGTWAPAGACLESDFLNVASVDPLRNGVFVVGSSGEGAPAISLLAFDGRRTRALPNPWGDVFPSGMLSATERLDGTLDIVTPCHIAPPVERPCLDATGGMVEGPWTWYRQARGGGAVTTVLPSVPAWAVPDPRGASLAWVDERGLCLAPFSDTLGPPACVALPAK